MVRTRPIGIPPGKSPPSPEVTTTSPTWMPLPSRAMYLKRRVPRGSPSMMPGVRVRTTWAPTVEAGSVSTCTTEEPARTSTMRPTRPSGAMTAVRRATASPRPRLIVSERTQPPHSRAMLSPAMVSSGSDSFSVSSRRSRWFSASVSGPRSASTRSRCVSSRSRRFSARTFFQSRYVPHTPRVARLTRARTVWIGVVTRASASEAPTERPRIWRVRSSRQTPATMPSSASARILTSTPRQCAAARDHDALVDDVGRELGWRTFKAGANGLHYRHHRLPQRLADLLVGDHDGLGNAVDQVAPLYFHRSTLATHRVRRPEGHLDLLRAALADQQVVVLLDVLHDRLVHLVARDADRLRVDDTRQRDHGNLGGAATDVHDHVAAGFLNRQAGADRGRHGLLDQVNLPRARLHGGVADGALLDLRDARRDADDDARPHERPTTVHLGNEVVQHLLGDVEVGDDAVLERPDGYDVARGAAEHRFRLVPHRQHRVIGLVDRDDGRLVEHDALAADVDQRVRRSQVHREIVREHPGQQVVEHLVSIFLYWLQVRERVSVH